MADPIEFFGLLYIDRKRNDHANLDRGPGDPVEIYIACAALTAMSAKASGIHFSIFTNEPAAVAQGLRERGLADVPILSLDFSLAVPDVKVFYSAHFKLDVIAALGTGRFGSRVGLVDIDTVFCSRVPELLTQLPTTAIAAYDVSRPENPLHCDKRMVKTLSVVAGRPVSTPRWFGGEFLFGSSNAMAALAGLIADCWPRYVGSIRKMHHVGDETPLSAALNIMSDEGFRVVDIAGTETAIRWWSTGASHPQPAFDDIADHFLLHLPADKPFLAGQARQPFSKGDFLAAYRGYLRQKVGRKRLLDRFRPWVPARIESTAAHPFVSSGPQRQSIIRGEA